MTKKDWTEEGGWEGGEGGADRQGEGACDSEISIVRGLLCVLCEVYFGGCRGH